MGYVPYARGITFRRGRWKSVEPCRADRYPVRANSKILPSFSRGSPPCSASLSTPRSAMNAFPADGFWLPGAKVMPAGFTSPNDEMSIWSTRLMRHVERTMPREVLVGEPSSRLPSHGGLLRHRP